MTINFVDKLGGLSYLFYLSFVIQHITVINNLLITTVTFLFANMSQIVCRELLLCAIFVSSSEG